MSPIRFVDTLISLWLMNGREPCRRGLTRGHDAIYEQLLRFEGKDTGE
jgi:hypothetical protein